MVLNGNKAKEQKFLSSLRHPELVEGSVRRKAEKKTAMGHLKWIFIAGACVASILWAFPKLVTGNYADITITKITPELNGQVSVDISIISSSGTGTVEAIYDGNRQGGGGSGAGGGFLGRPGKGSTDLFFTLNPEKAPPKDTVMESSWFGRLLIHEGEKRSLRGGERMYFYDFRTSDGVRHCGYIEAESTGKLALN